MKQELQIVLNKIKKKFWKDFIFLKPNFLIPGVGRSGTTTLYSYLKQHPEIYMNEYKEPNYFSRYYHLGQNWYSSQFKSKRNFSLIGEASTPYFDTIKATKRIYHFNPNFKLIFMLRNPVDRAFSHYKWDIENWGELRSFEELLIKSDRYLWPGKYYTHISRFLRFFKKKNMLFIIFERFIEEKYENLKKVCEFLDINPNFKFNPNLVNKNPSRMPCSLSLQRFKKEKLSIEPIEPISIRFTKLGIGLIIQKVNHFYKCRDFPKFKENTKRYLKKYYEKEILKLEKLINENLIIWKTI